MPARALDLRGQTFGRLTAVKRVANAKDGKARWLCLCSCGRQIEVRRACLRSGQTRSCGCLAKEVAREHASERCKERGLVLPPGESAFRELVRQYKRGAGDRGYTWALSDDECRLLFSSACHYCGAPPRREKKIAGGNGEFRFNGIDRINNQQGYEPGNVVPCCSTCNAAKSNRD